MEPKDSKFENIRNIFQQMTTSKVQFESAELVISTTRNCVLTITFTHIKQHKDRTHS